ncbi:hypothetical protein CSKR_104317 [Clonorchis sinensis]|uniref:Uncharacterized protein n=1 Tax=Clonorchis sinensis TaxID=79923 RepID=A0A3R7GSD9_CLOSI|nr:hypothetical protein CSKR_104317 [Clonorchis sinensis]
MHDAYRGSLTHITAMSKEILELQFKTTLVKEIKSFRIFLHRSNELRNVTGSSNEANRLCQFEFSAPGEKQDNHVRDISLVYTRQFDFSAPGEKQDNHIRGDRTKKDERSQENEKTSKGVKVSGKFW